MKLQFKAYFICIIGLCEVLLVTHTYADTPDIHNLRISPNETTIDTEKDTVSTAPKKRGKFTNLIYNTITTTPSKTVDLEAAKHDKEYLQQYEGRTINNIYVFRNNVFENDSRLWLDRTGNNIHVVTGEKQIRKDLLFKQGDKLNTDIILRNRRLIRSRDYISDVNMIVSPSEVDSTLVDIYVLTRDKWTISADFESKGNGESFIKLYDDNILGWGSRLSISTYFDWKHKMRYGGNLVEFQQDNLFGTFFDGRIVAGKGFDDFSYGIELQKEFIQPTDYAGGLTALYKRNQINIFPTDTSVLEASRQFDLWGGKSFALPGLKSSIYFTGRYFKTNYLDRLDNISANEHPYFHNEAMALASIGLYQERFLTASHIYGYGVKEYIAYGYRFGLTGGHSWGEFGDRWYLGGDFGSGYFTKVGYFGWSFAMGSYINRNDGKFYRTTMIANANWFSNLWENGRYRFRQFINLNGTRGWNRMNGFRETLGFTHDAGLRGLDDDVYGTNRLVINSETVIFTPWNIANFRMALFGFADFGLIGDNGNVFKNNFYTTLGVGVRIKNEKLIFNTINIRLGVALNRHGFTNAEYFRLSSEDRLNPIRYIPNKATPIDYK